MFGVLAGIIGFSPLVLAQYLARRGSSGVRQQSIAIGLLLVFGSLIILFAALFVVSQVARERLLVFGMSAVVAFLVAAAVMAIKEFRRLS
jgi:hypothetical protein